LIYFVNTSTYGYRGLSERRARLRVSSAEPISRLRGRERRQLSAKSVVSAKFHEI